MNSLQDHKRKDEVTSLENKQQCGCNHRPILPWSLCTEDTTVTAIEHQSLC